MSPSARSAALAPSPAVAACVLWLAIALGLVGCRSRSAPPREQCEPCAPASAGEADGTAALAAGLAGAPRPASGHENHGAAPVPYAECPVPGETARDVDELLDRAWKRYESGEFAVAYACAEIAAELVPQSVEAHHIQAAAGAALGHFAVAQFAFTRALAIDPDDPQTLAAAADFYINVLPPKRRETTMIGLEYARRGRARAVTRRRQERAARARLALLEAQAWNDLGQPHEALERVDAALQLAPDLLEATHERGVALFNLCRFEESMTVFEQVLRQAPEDPYAHHHLALILERLGRAPDAEAHFRRARALAPNEFAQPVLLSAEEFSAELDRAVSELSAELRAMLEQVELEVADVPSVADLTAIDPPFSPTILGLFRGLPLGADAPSDADPGTIPPRGIVLYRNNLARAVKTRDELLGQIRRTLYHEIGHLQGMDEDELRRRGLD